MGNKIIKSMSLKDLLPMVYLLLAILFIYSCSKASIRLGSDTVIIENVLFYPQKDFQCGPSSLASVMNFWGLNITPEDIAKDIFSKSARGTLTIDMVLYAGKKGLYSFQYKGSWEDLKSNISKGYPLIVLVDYGIKPFYQANHFMVVIGYNEDGVIVNSDKREKIFIKKDSFLDLWEKTDYWTLLIKKEE